MNVLIGTIFVLLSLAIAFDSQAAGRFDSLDALEPVIAGGEVVRYDSNNPIVTSTVLILEVEKTGRNGITFDGGSICTGTIISADLIVTAAHCVVVDDSEDLMPPTSFLVEMSLFYDGKSDLPRPSSVRVLSVRRHPNYKHKGAENDIALIRLASPLKPGYRPATVLAQSQRLNVGLPVMVAGYGSTTLTGQASSFRLRSFEYEIKELSSNATYVNIASSNRGGIGNGDSGGPAFSKVDGQLVLWGVASTSSDRDYEMVNYENVNSFRPWLVEAAREMGTDLYLL